MRQPGPCWATPTTTRMPTEINIKAQPASSTFLEATRTGKSDHATTIVTKRAIPDPRITETTTDKSNSPTTPDLSQASNRSCAGDHPAPTQPLGRAQSVPPPSASPQRPPANPYLNFVYEHNYLTAL